MVVKELHGDALNESMKEDDEDIVNIYESKWYNKTQLIDVYKKRLKNEYPYLTDAEITNYINSYSATLDDEVFSTVTGTINGGNMTFTDEDGTTTTYTKGGGSTKPGTDPGTDPGTNDRYEWITVTDTKFGNYENVFAITYANGKFVAVGGYASMAYSSDGVTWTAVEDNKFDSRWDHIYAITYGNNKFVVTGSDGMISYSTDVITWTAVDTGTLFKYVTSEGNTRTSIIRTIAYGGGRFVAGGEQGKMATSMDGVTWTAVTTDAFDYDVTSSEGEISHRKATIYSIAYGNGKFVAGCEDGIIATSSDGETWAAISTDVFDHVSIFGTDMVASVYTIAYGGGKFVAGSNYCDTVYSSDGITWTKVAENGLEGSIYTIAYGNNKFIAGDAGGRIAISSDGVTWTSAGSSILGSDRFSYGYGIAGIAYGNNRFIAAGSGKKIAYSTWK
jgi:hypothetical protein